MDKQLQINAQHGLHGQLSVPGDKSISHRAIMIGSLATGETHVHHFLTSADCLATLQAFKNLGVQIDRQGDEVVVHGVGMHGLKRPEHALQMANSGTTTRLMMGLLAGQAFESRLIGDDSLSKRPMRRVADPLAEMGASIETTEGHLPAVVHGQTLKAADIQLKVASAK